MHSPTTNVLDIVSRPGNDRLPHGLSENCGAIFCWFTPRPPTTSSASPIFSPSLCGQVLLTWCSLETHQQCSTKTKVLYLQHAVKRLVLDQLVCIMYIRRFVLGKVTGSMNSCRPMLNIHATRGMKPDDPAAQSFHSSYEISPYVVWTCTSIHPMEMPLNMLEGHGGAGAGANASWHWVR